MSERGLEFQLVDVKFTDGLDTRTQRKLVIPGKWNSLINATLTADGTPRRRDGVAPLVAAANGNGLATHGDELLVLSGPTIKSVADGNGTPYAVTQSGSIGNVFIEKDEIKKALGTADSIDCASGGGVTVYVWRDANGAGTVQGIKCSVFDETTGALIQSEAVVSSLATAFTPRVVFSVNAFFIFFIDTAGNTLNCRTILVATPAVLGSTVALITNVGLANRNIDAIDFGGAGTTPSVMVVYGWATAPDSVRDIRVIHTAGVPSIGSGPNNLILAAAKAPATLSGFAICAFSNSLAGVFALSTGALALDGLAGLTIDATGAVVTAAALLDVKGTATAGECHVTAVLTAAGTMAVFWDSQAAFATNAYTSTRTVTVSSVMAIVAGQIAYIPSASFAGTTGLAAGPRGPWICGKAFLSNSRLYLPMCVLDGYPLKENLAAGPPQTATVTLSEQNTFFLFDVTSALVNGAATVVAKALYGTLGCPKLTYATNPIVGTPTSVFSASGVFSVATTHVTHLQFAAGLNQSSTGIARLKMTPNFSIAPMKAELGGSTFISGGNLTAYDGFQLVEHGFPLFPEGIGATQTVGGGAMTAGTHQVVAVYEWYDSAGQRHQSAPSLPASITVAANDRITMNIPNLLVSQKTNIDIVLYMTAANGLSFYRIYVLPGFVPNVISASFAAYTIAMDDPTLIQNELLYNQPDQAGTTLGNFAPPGNNALTVHQNRLFTDVADSPNEYRYSQQYISLPPTGLQFNEALGGTVDVSSGGIVGFSPLDEKVIIFCRRKLYAVYGTGPNADGGFSNYSEPQQIPSDVGCVEVRSILKMPHGVIFKSAKGWYLLGRDLTVKYIGAGVEAYNTQTVSSAVLMEDRQECRFSNAQGYYQLIYSYLGDQWSIASISVKTVQGTGVLAIADAVYWATGGYYAHVSTSKGLNKDTPGVFLDAPGTSQNAVIVATAQTAWLKLQVLSGFQRVRRLLITGTSPNAPTSSLAVSVDFDDAYSQAAPGSYTFTTAMSGITFPAGTSIDLRHKLHRQKCKSVAFMFVDTPTEANPAGVNLQALTLEVGVKRGPNKLPAAQSV